MNLFKKIFKNYKKLYLIEKDNNKKLVGQNSLLSKERIHSEKKVLELKAELAKIKIDLEDTKGFLEQEKECSNALRKERTKLRKMVTRLGGDWKDGN